MESNATNESSIKRMQRKHFIETCGALFDWWIEEFPRATVVKEQRVKLKGIVQGNDDRELECLQTWHEQMKTPLAPSVKYGHALKRILGSHGILYHACEYNDAVGLLASCHDFKSLQSLDLLSCLESKPECKVQLWSLIKQLNEYALQYFDETLTVPTREEIQSNIKIHKASKQPGRPAVVRGFEAAFSELWNELVGILPPTTTVTRGTMGTTETDTTDTTGTTGTSVKDLQHQMTTSVWTEAMGKYDLHKICKARDITAFCNIKFSDTALCDVLRQVLHKIKDETKDNNSNSSNNGDGNGMDGINFTSHTWDLIEQINSFATVNGNVPSKVMRNIETTAHKLAGEIACGRADLSTLNLPQIGQSVLENCDVADVESLANNVGSLLPMLQTLQRTATTRQQRRQ